MLLKNSSLLIQSGIYAEIGEILSGSKPLPKVPDCGKRHYLFKSLGGVAG